MKLFYVILGATPKGRNIEQHDVFFGIAESLRELVPAMKNFWPEAKGQIHIDCYREVSTVDNYRVTVVTKTEQDDPDHLFFINLGGYVPGRFEELHEQFLMVDESMSNIIKRVKKTTFYRTMGFKNAESHIDDKHGVDIDDIYRVNDLLSAEMKQNYSIVLEKTSETLVQDQMHIGYLKIDKVR